jgi:hypothetical protein
MEKRFNDLWLRIICIPLLAAFGVIISNYRELRVNGVFTGDTLFYFLILIFFVGLIWHVNLYIHHNVRKRYERFEDKQKLVQGWVVRLLLYGINTILIVFLATLLFNWNNPVNAEFFFRFLQALSFALLFSYLVSGFYETRYFIYEWNKSIIEAADLKQLNLQIQVDSLKNQINPHFLFNSLNTLSALIESDSRKAEIFVDEMSTVYRYVLQNNEKNLITLQDELRFVHSYVDLLQTRYEQALEVQINVGKVYLDYLLPPLTLQLLVENAVKHNVVSSKRSLRINIYTDVLGQLIVENNVQSKTTAVRSNKLGLSNIFAKYQILNQPPVIVNHTHSVFQVILPLILPVVQTGGGTI